MSETSDAGMETGPALSALACVEETKSDFGETERRECGERTGTWIEYDGMGKHGRKDSAGTSTEFDEMGRWGRPEVRPQVYGEEDFVRLRGGERDLVRW